jgi:hypothetical protein
VAYLKALPRPRCLLPRTLAAELRRRLANPSRPPLISASSPLFRCRGDPRDPRVEVRSTLVQLVHIPAFQSTQTSSPDLRRRGRSPSAAVRRRRHPRVRRLSSRARARRSGVFPVEIGAPRAFNHAALPLAVQRRRCRAVAGRPPSLARVRASTAVGSRSDGPDLARPGQYRSTATTCARNRSQPSDLDPADQIRSPALTTPFCSKAPRFS